jgi:hypothetical protein
MIKPNPFHHFVVSPMRFSRKATRLFILMMSGLFCISFATSKPIDSNDDETANGISNTRIIKAKTYRKGLFGEEEAGSYKAGDSAFHVQVMLMSEDSLAYVQSALYYQPDHQNIMRVDTLSFATNVRQPFFISFFRQSYAWAPGQYIVKIFTDGDSKEISFLVYPEETLDGMFLVPTFSPQKKAPDWERVSALLQEQNRVKFRLFVDPVMLEDKQKITIVWFIELPGDEPLYLNETAYQLPKQQQEYYNFIDFLMANPGGWPQGFLVAEVWVDDAFSRFFRIQTGG